MIITNELKNDVQSVLENTFDKDWMIIYSHAPGVGMKRDNVKLSNGKIIPILRSLSVTSRVIQKIFWTFDVY